jgi:hypothetical protein
MDERSVSFAFEQLRIVRDEILAYWDSRTDVHGRGMWASDVRRAWNLLVEAFDRAASDQPAGARLFGARSALEQAMSTLVMDDRSKELAGRFPPAPEPAASKSCLVPPVIRRARVRRRSLLEML